MANTVLDSLAGAPPSWQPDADPAGADLNQPVIGDALEASSPTELSAELRSIKGNTRVLSLDPAWVNFEGCDDTRFCPSAAKAARFGASQFTLAGDWTAPLGSGRPAIAQIGRRVRITLDSGVRFIATVATVLPGGTTTVTITPPGGLINAGDAIDTLEWGLLVPDETPFWLEFDTVQLGGIAQPNGATVSFGGTGYATGNILTVVGGDGLGRVTVTTIDPGGVVTGISVVDPGSGYAVDTAGALHGTTGGDGTGCTIQITALTIPSSLAFVVPTRQGGTGRVDAGGSSPVNATLLQGTPVSAAPPTAYDVLGLSPAGAILTFASPPSVQGSGYAVDDILRVTGDGDGTATFKVTSIDGPAGLVTGLVLTFAGSGYHQGGSPRPTTSVTGFGVGCDIDITTVSTASQWASQALASFLVAQQVVAASPGAFTIATLAATDPQILVCWGITAVDTVPRVGVNGGILSKTLAWPVSFPKFNPAFYVGFATATAPSVVATIATGQDITSGVEVTLKNFTSNDITNCAAYVLVVGRLA